MRGQRALRDPYLLDFDEVGLGQMVHRRAESLADLEEDHRRLDDGNDLARAWVGIAALADSQGFS